MKTIYATDRVHTLLPRIKDLIREHVLPLEKTFSYQKAETLWPEILRIRALVKSQGLWGLALHDHVGGHGLTLSEFGQLSEAMAWSPFLGHLVFGCQAPDIGNIELLEKFAGANLQDQYVKPLLNGDIRSCFAMTEPEFAGSNPTRLATTAVLNGDQWVLNGHKWFTTGADGAAFCIVMAVTEPEAPAHQRASMILVPMDVPGLHHIRNIPVFGEAGSGWFSHAELRFEDCKVPANHLIGTRGAGFKLAQERLGPGRIHHCMRWIGQAERIMDMMCRRAVSREIDEGVRLSDKQLIQAMIAESRIEINSARLMVLHAAHQIDQWGASTARGEIAAIKYQTARMFLTVLDRAIQMHGALGVTDDIMLATLYRHERGARIWDGADEVHIQQLAKWELKPYL